MKYDIFFNMLGKLLAFICVLYSIISCSSIGHHKVPTDSFNYNEAIGHASNQQMLLNIVRLHHYDVPVFLSISSVLTQYAYSGSVGVDATTGNSGGFNDDSVGIESDLIYFERPTITYSPLSGQEFAQQLLEPIDRDTMFSLMQSGWPAEQILIMGLERLGQFKNLTIDTSRPEEEKSLIEFVEAIQILLDLSNNNAIEMRQSVNPDDSSRKAVALYFDTDSSEHSQQLWMSFKEKLQLDVTRNQFFVVDKVMGVQSDEILVRTRSLLALMSHLAQGIDINNVTSKSDQALFQNQWLRSKLVPITILKSKQNPANAFVSVKYNNEWYFIENTDYRSKQTFGMLTYIYLLQSPRPPTAGPLITVPTN